MHFDSMPWISANENSLMHLSDLMHLYPTSVDKNWANKHNPKLCKKSESDVKQQVVIGTCSQNQTKINRLADSDSAKFSAVFLNLRLLFYQAMLECLLGKLSSCSVLSLPTTLNTWQLLGRLQKGGQSVLTGLGRRGERLGKMKTKCFSRRLRKESGNRGIDMLFSEGLLRG